MRAPFLGSFLSMRRFNDLANVVFNATINVFADNILTESDMNHNQETQKSEIVGKI